MKIVHIALKSIFTEGWSYQENFLTKYHIKFGHDVSLITNLYVRNKSNINKVGEETVINNHFGLKIIRLKEKRNRYFQSILSTYPELESYLNNEDPDLIFLHGLQIRDYKVIKRYIKKTFKYLIIDNHADFSNSGRSFISKYILHTLIWRFVGKSLVPFTHTFFGVSPDRVNFLINVYKIPSSKVDLLNQGADDDLVMKHDFKGISLFKKKYNLCSAKHIIATGGKLERYADSIVSLIEAFQAFQKKNDNIVLLIFGSLNDEIRNILARTKNQKNILYVGWLNIGEIYNIIKISQGFIFTGKHSVLWEQVIAHDKPILIESDSKYDYLNSKNKVLMYKKLDMQNLEKFINFTKININNHRTFNKEFLYSEISKKTLKKMINE